MTKFILLLLFSLLSIVGFGKSAGSIRGDGHSGDMVRVLGIDLSNKNAAASAEKLTTGFAKYIDEDYEELLGRIRKIAPKFNSRGYRHRLFFHWGLNGDPRKLAVLRDCVVDAADGDAALEGRIWDVIIEEQRRRNKEMFGVVKSSYPNAPLHRDDVRGIASIVYDTHIIGDYIVGTEITQKALLGINLLKKDIVKAVWDIALRDPDFKENKLIVQFRKDIEGSTGQPMSDVLKIMETQIPVILGKCPRVAKALGINAR